MSFTCDCSDTISGEHWISKSILKATGDKIGWRGLPWQAPDELGVFGVNSLTANILCKRHNNAFSILDSVALRFFTALQEIDAAFDRVSMSRAVRLWIAKGEHLELWGLKTLVGIYMAGIARDQAGAPLKTADNLDLARFCAPLTGRPISHPNGLYVRAQKGQDITHRNYVEFAPLLVAKDNRLIGLGISLRGWELTFLFDAADIDVAAMTPMFKCRPSELKFVHASPRDRRLMLISLGWSNAEPLSINLVKKGSIARSQDFPSAPFLPPNG